MNLVVPEGNALGLQDVNKPNHLSFPLFYMDAALRVSVCRK